MTLLEIFPEWFVYMAFVCGIATMAMVTLGALVAAWHLRKREPMTYAEDEPTYPWGPHQSDD